MNSELKRKTKALAQEIEDKVLSLESIIEGMYRTGGIQSPKLASSFKKNGGLLKKKAQIMIRQAKMIEQNGA